MQHAHRENPPSYRGGRYPVVREGCFKLATPSKARST